MKNLAARSSGRIISISLQRTVADERLYSPASIRLAVVAAVAASGGTLIVHGGPKWLPAAPAVPFIAFQEASRSYSRLHYLSRPQPGSVTQSSLSAAKVTFGSATAAAPRGLPRMEERPSGSSKPVPAPVVATSAASSHEPRSDGSVQPRGARRAAARAIARVDTQAPLAIEPEFPLEPTYLGAAELQAVGTSGFDDAEAALHPPVDLRHPQDQPQGADVASSASSGLTATPAPAAVKFKVQTAVNGASSGAITLLILSPDEARDESVSTEIYLPVSELLALVADRMEPGLVHAIEASSHIDKYVTLNDLRAQGISVSFDDNDRLVLKS